MRMLRHLALLTLLGFPALVCSADPKDKSAWTDPADPTLPVDFKIQGEYAGDKIGVQVIALGGGELQAVVLPGGLPGAGWDGKDKSLMSGKVDGSKAMFEPATGKRSYIAQDPAKFSATSKYPPEGQKDYTATADGSSMTLKGPDGKEATLKKTVRESPTMGAKPPAGAVVLFDGSNLDEWNGGRLDTNSKTLNTDRSNAVSKKNFNNYSAHVEFLVPYTPYARSQGRGNSGFYQVLMYEVQVLDSFGLDGKNNECGGIYSKVAPKVNMCSPPLVWQTYDADFTNAVAEGGKVVKPARLTLKHNGVVVHEDTEIKGKTGGARGDAEGTPGPFLLQQHGNPVQFRNIWVVEKK